MIDGLAEKLRILRDKYNFSQRDVANNLGISPSIISSYEAGERTPSTKVLLKLSYLYQCSTDYLLGKETPVSSIILDTTGLTDEQIQALSHLISTMKK